MPPPPLPCLQDGGVTREVVLGWLCLMAQLNAERNTLGERGVSGAAAQELVSGEGASRVFRVFRVS